MQHSLAEILDPADDMLSEARDAFENMLMLYAEDPAFQEELRELFAPLLNGQMSHEEHRAYLRKHYGA